MGDAERLLAALKGTLKQRGMRYADLARALGVSEPTVKRMLSQGRIDLGRLERICEALELDFFELARIARGARDLRGRLSLGQEQALAQQPQLMIVFHLLCQDWTVAQIRSEFGLDAPATVRLLVTLDRLHLIELLPADRVRLRVPRDFAWREDGPVRARYLREASHEFLRDPFEGRDALLAMEIRELGDASMALLRRRLERLVAEFNECADLDVGLPPGRRRSVGLLLAMRPWAFSLLESLRAGRKPP